MSFCRTPQRGGSPMPQCLVCAAVGPKCSRGCNMIVPQEANAVMVNAGQFDRRVNSPTLRQ